MAVRDVIQAAAGIGGGDKLYVEDVFSTYLYTGNGSTQTITNGIALGINTGPTVSPTSSSTAIAVFNSAYYLANGGSIYKGAAPTESSFVKVQNYSGQSKVAAGASYVYSAANGNFYYSSDGTSWTQTATEPVGSYSYTADCMAEFGGNWYVSFTHPISGVYGNLANSSNLGASWTNSTSSPWYNSSKPKTLTVIGSRMYAFTYSGAGYYTTNGTSWTTISGAVAPNNIALIGSTYVIAGNDGHIYTSSNGQTFSDNGLLPGLTGTTAVLTIASNGTKVFAVGYGSTSGSFVYESSNGTTWTAITSCAGNGSGIQVTSVCDSSYFAYELSGIDLMTEAAGGMVWTKFRAQGSSGISTAGHALTDTVRGTSAGYLVSNLTAAQSSTYSDYALSAFTSSGFSLQYSGVGNENGALYASWTFRKAPKFFDVVTYTGNGVAGRTIAHNLGSAPGAIIVKRTDTTGNWPVWHRSGDQTDGKRAAYLNLTDAYENTATAVWNNTAVPPDMNATTFTVGVNDTNVNGGTYVAYLFAHNAGGFGDDGLQNVISCGSTGGGKVTLGWEPQWILHKSSNFSSNWMVLDNMRGLPWGAQAQMLNPNLSNAEALSNDTVNTQPYSPKIYADGFELGTLVGTHIYIAIRRPMKTPESGTEVFSAVDVGTSNPANVTSGFPVDFFITDAVNNYASNLTGVATRLTGNVALKTQAADPEASVTNAGFQGSTGLADISDANGWLRYSGNDQIYWMFKRAPGFFDVVCYTGTGVAGRTVNHNLGVAPELMIMKDRTSYNNWAVYNPNARLSLLNQTGAEYSAAVTATNFGDGTNVLPPTSSLFYIGASANVNTSSDKYVAYLFASCPGVSKVGSYTGTGTTKQINCGFSSGARFVLIKRTDSTGDWYVWDSARGIVSGNDPYLLLNSTAAENTSTDYIDPYSAGFEISSTAPAAINASGGSFIYLAIA